jgi:hypothetical protein
MAREIELGAVMVAAKAESEHQSRKENVGIVGFKAFGSKFRKSCTLAASER